MISPALNLESRRHAASVRHFANGLAEAEHLLHAITAGGIDAIVDSTGHTHLLRPAQEHLRRNEARLQSLLDSVPDVIMVVGRDAVIVSLSKSALQLLGPESGNLVGKNLMDAVHPDDRSALQTAFMSVVEGLCVDVPVNFRHCTEAGAFLPLEATVSKLRDAPGPTAILICRDLSRCRSEEEAAARRETALTQASQAKDHFLAMLSHELRTPLTPALMGVDELLADERFVEARPVLAIIRRNIEMEGRLLEELIDFTTVGQYKVRLRTESLDAHEAVRSVVKICGSEIAAANIVVNLDLEAAEETVLADSVRLQQVMWNLVKNSIKFSTPGSSISITSVNDAPGRLTLAFTDHGVGIAPELLPLVFDAFQQGGRSMLQVYGGLGLGLFIAKGLAEAQGGTLTVASAGRGQGATFRLSLKTASATALDAVETPGHPGSLPV